MKQQQGPTLVRYAVKHDLLQLMNDNNNNNNNDNNNGIIGEYGIRKILETKWEYNKDVDLQIFKRPMIL